MNRTLLCLVGSITLLAVSYANAFDSGSTGVDGAFSPQSDIQVSLPPDGILNYTSLLIPNGVTVTFEKNANNTPVVILVQEDAVIAGTLNVSANGPEAGAGGFNGGLAGFVGALAGAGSGPGGGTTQEGSCNGGGGSYGTQGIEGFTSISPCNLSVPTPTYGREELVPLVGGSGGGGGGPSGAAAGTSGGGGGGAILIAASGTIDISGAIYADGGDAPDHPPSPKGMCGGQGSGGAIRLVATMIDGNGVLSAAASPPGCFGAAGSGAPGGAGRIRLEAEIINRVASSDPVFSADAPQPVFIPNFPTIAISEVAGIAVPANPTGMNDLSLPASAANPVSLQLSTSNVPPGSVVTVSVLPRTGLGSEVTATPVGGTLEDVTATASIDIPNGNSTLNASVEFLVDSTTSINLAPYADGQLVARIRSSYEAGVGSVTTLITHDGKEYTWPTAALN